MGIHYMMTMVRGAKGPLTSTMQDSCDQHADTTSSFDLLLSLPGEESCLDNERLFWKRTLAHHLEESMLDDINDWSLAFVLCVLSHLFIADQAPDLVNVDRGADLPMLDDVEVAHTNLTKETRVILVPHDPVVMLASCIA